MIDELSLNGLMYMISPDTARKLPNKSDSKEASTGKKLSSKNGIENKAK